MNEGREKPLSELSVEDFNRELDSRLKAWQVNSKDRSLGEDLALYLTLARNKGLGLEIVIKKGLKEIDIRKFCKEKGSKSSLLILDPLIQIPDGPHRLDFYYKDEYWTPGGKLAVFDRNNKDLTLMVPSDVLSITCFQPSNKH